MKIRLIASDLDGTLLTDKKEITSFTREILQKTARQGIWFVPATGRAFHSIPGEVLNLPKTEYVITSNGAAIYSVSQEKRIYERLLEREAVETVLQLPIPSEVAVEAFVKGVPYSSEEFICHAEDYGATEYGAEYVRRTRRGVPDVRDFIKEHAGELDSLSFLCADKEKREELRQLLGQKIPKIYVTSSVPHMLEIGNEDAGKGKTLKYLLQFLGISAKEAMAFGDADNDIDMLKEVAYGIAMENGTESCKKAAFSITGTNNENGVARAILSLASL